MKKSPEKRAQTGDSAPPQDRGFVKSATRVLDLFEHLRRWGSRMTHTEFAEQLGIPKSSLSHLVKTLVARGYLDYEPLSKSYGLGPALTELAQRGAEEQDLLSVAQEALIEIAQETGESCGLHVLAGQHSQIALWQSGTQRLKFTMEVGEKAPLYATSGGKVLLAYVPKDLFEQYLQEVEFEKFTPFTTASAKKLRADVNVIRKNGYAVVRNEYTDGICAISRPILNREGNVLGSIVISVPSLRFDAVAQKCMAILKQYQDIVSKRVNGN
jgi:DNA-binding IclR family transcriptional regulator